MGFNYIKIYYSLMFNNFLIIQSLFLCTLHNMVQAFVQYYPGLVNKHKNWNLNKFYYFEATLLKKNQEMWETIPRVFAKNFFVSRKGVRGMGETGTVQDRSSLVYL
jgi:hypothetical protein